jgi:hypothetical protein
MMMVIHIGAARLGVIIIIVAIAGRLRNILPFAQHTVPLEERMWQLGNAPPEPPGHPVALRGEHDHSDPNVQNAVD